MKPTTIARILPNQLHMEHNNMRIRWSCFKCFRRNDHRVPLPVRAREVFVCKKCKHATAIGFQVAT